MAAKEPGRLPTYEPSKSVLHPKYLVTLLNEGEEPVYYAGEIYKTEFSETALAWKKETKNQPYLDLIRQSVQAFPDLQHLASWMEVSTTVSRYMYLSKNTKDREERVERVKVRQIDFKKGSTTTEEEFLTIKKLKEALENGKQTESTVDARVYVVEDLSRVMIEAFGDRFDIDPHFFRAHINDYMWNTPTGDAVELKHLDAVSRRQPHFRISYLRPRYYRDTDEFKKATEQAAGFNVLRSVDSDRIRTDLENDEGAVATLMRAKASIWTRPAAEGRCSITILLVDPTLSSGYPLWGGYSSFTNWTRQGAVNKDPWPTRQSLYHDVVYWMLRMDEQDIDEMINEPNACAVPLLWLILSDFQQVVQYVTALLGEIDWQIALPSLRTLKGVDATMRKLHPWRRNVTLYRSMVSHAIDRIFTKKIRDKVAQGNDERGLQSLLKDFELILKDIDMIQNRMERIVSVAQALQSIEESRRAMQQNQNVARLTYLATVFIPLSFVSGFLSMVPDVTQLRRTYWVFFVIAIPLTTLALFAVDFLGLRTKIGNVIGRKEGKIKNA